MEHSRWLEGRAAAVVDEFGELALAQFLSRLEQLDTEHLRRLIEPTTDRAGLEDA